MKNKFFEDFLEGKYLLNNIFSIFGGNVLCYFCLECEFIQYVFWSYLFRIYIFYKEVFEVVV